jgi:hypothetical protein
MSQGIAWASENQALPRNVATRYQSAVIDQAARDLPATEV